ncbi:MAG: ABC transporter substrate-binding protein, partial [Solirubrobacterales bacterium]
MSARLGSLLIAALVALAVGCGEKEEDAGSGGPEPFAVALDFFVNPDHAGLLTAVERGYFEQAGLEVSTRVPSDPSAPIKQV